MAEKRKTMIERLEDLGSPSIAVPPKAIEDGGHVLDDADSSSADAEAGSEVLRVSSSDYLASRSGIGKKNQHVEHDCQVYRPTRRPPMALLYILDDGSKTAGESVRIRRDRVVIGRDQADVVVPNDIEMSATHAEIIREVTDGRPRWVLRDLGSTNGTFVRVTNGPLKHHQEIMIGSRRYRFEEAPQSGNSAAGVSDEASPQRQATMGWRTVSSDELKQMLPGLVEQKPDGSVGERLSFQSDTETIGSDPKRCSLMIENDPFVSGMHAQVVRKNTGRWVIKETNSVNGVWFRISTLPIHTTCEFQLGEQRFLFVQPTSTG